MARARTVPPPRGRVTISGTSETSTSVTVELGHRHGAISLHLSPVSGGTDDEIILHLRWRGRPGDPVSVEERGMLTDKEYLAHAKLDLRTGEMYPGWQQGDNQEEAFDAGEGEPGSEAVTARVGSDPEGGT